jgi:predicted ATP-grasp superfamily ATP-dependent carboligase
MDAVILGASPNALSAVRSLGRAGLEVVVAAAKSNRTFKRSRYAAGHIDLENLNDAGITTRLMSLPEPHERPFLLATGDRFALFVAKYQQLLSSKYCFVVPSYATLDAIIDKAKLYQTAQNAGVPHPQFCVVADRRDVDAAIAGVPTPCYVKPALAHEWRAFADTKIERAETETELRRILDAFIERGLVAVPLEIIPGSDTEVFSVCTYIDRSGTPIAWRTKRKLRQYPLDTGDASAQEICDEPKVAELGLNLLAITGHRGPATVEFRRDARNGRFVLMEINARTILGQEMITRSGFDVPLAAYRDAKGQPMQTVGAPSFVRWASFGADFRAFKGLRKRGALTTPRWLASILGCRCFAYFAPDDPWPLLTRIGAWLAHWMKRLLARASS